MNIQSLTRTYKSASFLLLIAATLLTIHSPCRAADRKVTHWNKSSEVKASEVIVSAFDLKAGTLYLVIDGHNLYFEPSSEDNASRILAISAILSELRKAKSVVVSYSDEKDQIGNRYFPAYAPLSNGTVFNSLGAFYFRY